MLHNIKYTVAENIGGNPKDIKNKKLDADEEWLACFKPRTAYDMLAYTAIKSKKNTWIRQFHNGRLIKRIKQTDNSII